MIANISKITAHPYNSYPEFVELRKKLSGAGQKDVFRVGASDIGSILGLNEYKDKCSFFYEACEFVPPPEFRSLDAIRGQIQESIIKEEYWRYLDPADPSSDAFLDNYLGNKTKYRDAHKGNAIYTNADYPWLFVSPDYLIEDGLGLVECKSYKAYVLDKYVEGIPRTATVQCQSQLMGTGRQYVELMAVIDATIPKMVRFDINTPLQNWIEINAKEFIDKVLEGKKIVYDPTLSEDEKALKLMLIQPEDEGYPTYSQFLKDWHKPENAKDTVDGPQELLEEVIDYLQIREEEGEVESRKLKRENSIREWFRGNDVGRFDFGSDIGSISYGKKLSVPKAILERVRKQQA